VRRAVEVALRERGAVGIDLARVDMTISGKAAAYRERSAR
jgi:hypothetical protein